MPDRFFIFERNSSLISIRIQCMQLVEKGIITLKDATDIVHLYDSIKRSNNSDEEYIKVTLSSN